jgi:site-specific recombinase XerD
MNNLATYLSTFLRDYLPCERGASQHTCDAYAYTFQLLVCFAAKCLNIQPSKLKLEYLDVSMVVKFLNYLETARGNCPQTRNARLAAIKAFFRFLEYRVPSVLEQALRIHAIPSKKFDTKLIDYLTQEEMQALLDAPNTKTVSGTRDRAMLYLAFAAGLRVSELVSLKVEQLNLRPEPSIHIYGKGRRERVIPLWKETSQALKAWLTVRDQQSVASEVFLNSQSRAMTRSGFKYILLKHFNTAKIEQPSLAKKHISPHVLRHTCAMLTLQATHDVRKVSLWLGHADIKTTEIYLRADPSKKLEALIKGSPLSLKRGSFKAPDKLIAMLKSKNFV